MQMIAFIWGRLRGGQRVLVVLLGLIGVMSLYHLTQPSAPPAEPSKPDPIVSICFESAKKRPEWTHAERTAWAGRCVRRINDGASIPDVLAADK